VDQALFAGFDTAEGVQARRLAALLRLAYTLHRGHETEEPSFAFRARGNTLKLDFRRGWLKSRPLWEADLAEESRSLKDFGFTLKLG
jgi:hypothetical protein